MTQPDAPDQDPTETGATTDTPAPAPLLRLSGVIPDVVVSRHVIEHIAELVRSLREHTLRAAPCIA